MENQEQKELDLLIGRGFPIETVLFGKTRQWYTKKMSLSRLIALSNVYITMQIDEEKFHGGTHADAISEQFIAVKLNAKKAAKAFAIACSSNLVMRWFLTWHFLKQIDSLEMKAYTQKLLNQSDYQSFMLSIILMNGNRITKPQMIEKQTG